MSKPWDNEPSPIIDKAADDAEDNPLASIYIWFDARNLERRLRHAERLLDKVCNWLRVDGELEQSIVVHLEAARQEDGR